MRNGIRRSDARYAPRLGFSPGCAHPDRGLLVATAELFLMRVLLMTGEFAEAERLSGPLLKDARERGDLYSALMNGTYVGANVLLAADDAAGARSLVRELMSEWPAGEFNTQHLHALWGETCIDLYCEDGAAAWERLSRAWPSTRASQNVQVIRIWMLAFHARCALTAAGQAGTPAREFLLRAAEADARRLDGTGVAFAAALARLFRAGVASSRGDQATARLRLTGAIDSLDAVAMYSYAAAARWRLGVLLGARRAGDSWIGPIHGCDPRRSATRPGWSPCTPPVSAPRRGSQLSQHHPPCRIATRPQAGCFPTTASQMKRSSSATAGTIRGPVSSPPRSSRGPQRAAVRHAEVTLPDHSEADWRKRASCGGRGHREGLADAGVLTSDLRVGGPGAGGRTGPPGPGWRLLRGPSEPPVEKWAYREDL